MLGAAFFHMLPEAVEAGGAAAVPFVVVGFLFLYLLERFVLVHVCAEPGPERAPLGLGENARRLPVDAARTSTARRPTSARHHGDATGCDVHTMGSPRSSG